MPCIQVAYSSSGTDSQRPEALRCRRQLAPKHGTFGLESASRRDSNIGSVARWHAKERKDELLQTAVVGRRSALRRERQTTHIRFGE
uniref:Uncharacterized protein n=1 Tax=Panagrellus redivivus TaxID=6233 RepID=A0A7E4UXP3_PANRE